MKTAQDIINECNQKDNMPFFTETVWGMIGAGLIGVALGIIMHAAIIAPFTK